MGGGARVRCGVRAAAWGVRVSLMMALTLGKKLCSPLEATLALPSSTRHGFEATDHQAPQRTPVPQQATCIPRHPRRTRQSVPCQAQVVQAGELGDLGRDQAAQVVVGQVQIRDGVQLLPQALIHGELPHEAQPIEVPGSGMEGEQYHGWHRESKSQDGMREPGKQATDTHGGCPDGGLCGLSPPWQAQATSVSLRPLEHTHTVVTEPAALQVTPVQLHIAVLTDQFRTPVVSIEAARRSSALRWEDTASTGPGGRAVVVQWKLGGRAPTCPAPSECRL